MFSTWQVVRLHQGHHLFCNLYFCYVLLQPPHTPSSVQLVYPPQPLLFFLFFLQRFSSPWDGNQAGDVPEVSNLEPHSVRVFPDAPVHSDLCTHAGQIVGVFSVLTLVVTGGVKEEEEKKKRRALLFAPACVCRSTWLWLVWLGALPSRAEWGVWLMHEAEPFKG